MTALSKIQRARFIDTKSKRNGNVLTYKKQDNFRYIFIYRMNHTLLYAIFIKHLKFAFIYKIMTLFVT